MMTKKDPGPSFSIYSFPIVIVGWAHIFRSSNINTTLSYPSPPSPHYYHHLSPHVDHHALKARQPRQTPPGGKGQKGAQSCAPSHQNRPDAYHLCLRRALWHFLASKIQDTLQSISRLCQGRSCIDRVLRARMRKSRTSSSMMSSRSTGHRSSTLHPSCTHGCLNLRTSSYGKT